MSLNYLLWALFGPSAWFVWLTLFSAAFLFIGAARAARATIVLLALWVVLFAILPTGNWLMDRLEAAYPRPAAMPDRIDAVAVLAGAEKLHVSALSGSLEFGPHGERVSEALALARTYPHAKIWTVGGVAFGGSRDVDWTADYWRRAGLEKGRIGKIAGTLDTCTNAQGIARALPGQRVLLVTSGFHMPRAMACMKAAGVDAIAYPVDRQAGDPGISLAFMDNVERADLALHEYAGLAWYRLTGRL
ncbi:YdcF family protein [Sphingosinicella microcystinivorans]|uniref:YdcF family protein n=1 Tax=Sphingosinicella microcystinivorans TaxID=335406 RepID=UPI0022F399F9|nr:YdcF family protein [Sphingosinicella microcystinivorans]WBX83960.1 YdcF family protein [Sphingosinicella microcystinivorans]